MVEEQDSCNKCIISVLLNVHWK